MAKGNNANSDLYKKLHEEYGLELNIDFYLHPQSGSYIIKHNAVKKLVAKQREKGFIIETPMGEDIIWLNDGTKEGVHGKEVVVAGNFYLKNKDGVVIEKVFKLGEVNAKNCKNLYPQTMALKRMYDRGVIDLLRFAQEGLYSDVEADVFKDKAPVKKKQENKSPEVAVAPKPQLPPPDLKMPKISAPEKKSIPVTHESSVEFKIMNVLIENPNGTSKSEMWNMIPNDKEEINSAIDKLMEEEKIIKTGERRGTKYHVKAEKSNTVTPLTKDEYNSLWREASEELLGKGFKYHDLMQVVSEVTGHNSAINAFKNGEMTKQHIEEIKRVGMLRTT